MNFYLHRAEYLGYLMSYESKKNTLVFDFIRPTSKRLDDIAVGKAPREMLLGYVQLRDRGWPISASEDRWVGFIGKLRQKLNFKLEIPSLKMIRHWQCADIIVVTTRISLVLAMVGKLLRKKLVFLDAMCDEVPERFWRQMTTKLALSLSDACICLSSSQAKHWADRLNIDIRAFNPLFYGVDLDFYKRPIENISHNDSKPYLLAVGRDPRRDFNTLVTAANKLDWDLKLVTQPYLVPKGVRDSPSVQVYEGISYKELFSLYAKATVVVVPVRKDTTYMSGIRATMEAVLLEAPVVASRISGMQEYFEHEKEILYFEPESCDSLLQAIHRIVNNNEFKEGLIERAKQRVTSSFSVSNYADSLEKILESL